jgi:hypothetical protein
VTLGANGTPVNGSTPVGIFLNCSLNYLIVLQDANHVVVSTTNNVSCSGTGSSGGGGTNYWTLSGSTITNNNGSGSGNVVVGANFNVGSNLYVGGSINMADAGSSPLYATIRAPATMSANVTWYWPPADATSAGQCMVSDGMGNLSFATCSGGGGGGTPGGALYGIQSNNPAGTFYADANFTYVPGTAVTLGSASFFTNGTSAGFGASTCTHYDCIQVPSGGFNGQQYNFIAASSPGPSGSGAATLYMDSSLNWPLLSSNASSYYPLAVTGAFSGFTTGHCVSTNITSGVLTLVDAGGACTTGGGGGTVASSSAGQVAVYSAATTVTGSGGLTYNTTTGVLATSGGSGPGIDTQAVSTTGPIQTLGTGVAGAIAITASLPYNSFSTVGGGAFCTGGACTGGPALQVGSAGQWQISAAGAETAASLKVSNLTSSGTQCVQASSTGVLSVTGSACGGSGSSPGGSLYAIQSNNPSGTFYGDANYTYVPGNAVTLGSASFQTNGTSSGFNAATCNIYNCLQAGSGGIYVRSSRASVYIGTGNSTGVPSATGGDGSFPVKGDMYFDNGLGTERLYTASGWVSLATGGISSLNSLTGALNITNGSTTNQITVAPSGTTIALTLPQGIGTGSSPQFTNGTFTGSVAVTSNLNSATYAASSILTNAISATNGGIYSFLGYYTPYTGLNSVNTAGSVNACSSGSCVSSIAYQVNSSTIINGSGTYLGNLSTPSSSSSVIYIGSVGNFYNRSTGASTGISCSGITDGWTAVTSDDYLVVCLGGSRFRSTLVSF